MNKLLAHLCSRLVVPLLFCVAGPAFGLPTPVASTFDSGLDGWVLAPGHLGTLSQAAAGGNPGGYIEFSDGGPTPGEILAPAAFLGDWSSLDGTGILSWDHRIINRGTSINAILPLQAFISGPGGSASFDSGLQATTTGWISATAPLTEVAWSLNSGTWLGLLSDVAELRVKIELVDNSDANDVHGIDNIALALSSVPEPSILVLFAISLFMLGFLRWSRQR